jgi:hypothetical protein
LILNKLQPFTGNESIVFAKGALTTTIITTVVWMTVTFVTNPEPEEVLLQFYRRVRPDARGWNRIAVLAPEIARRNDIGGNILAWLLGCVMVYCCLFGTGKILLHQSAAGLSLLIISAGAAWLLYRSVIRNFAAEPDEQSAVSKSVPDTVVP